MKIALTPLSRKIVKGVLALLVVVAGGSYVVSSQNEVKTLDSRLDQVEKRPAVVKEVVVTATPSATAKPVYRALPTAVPTK